MTLPGGGRARAVAAEAHRRVPALEARPCQGTQALADIRQAAVALPAIEAAG
jgi:hypothetical protein